MVKGLTAAGVEEARLGSDWAVWIFIPNKPSVNIEVLMYSTSWLNPELPLTLPPTPHHSQNCRAKPLWYTVDNTWGVKQNYRMTHFLYISFHLFMLVPLFSLHCDVILCERLINDTITTIRDKWIYRTVKKSWYGRTVLFITLWQWLLISSTFSFIFGLWPFLLVQIIYNFYAFK